ncbi:T9SS type A sorting domain-containing protein [Runella limosa]|uniref:T9SS type A sorting domain-containing protein n=1 Tax=Runella limosa TaxID=370978 RepID=UPI00049172E6|nr:T9SS type A sorting domain-containing protein [Runella limosa]
MRPIVYPARFSKSMPLYPFLLHHCLGILCILVGSISISHAQTACVDTIITPMPDYIGMGYQPYKFYHADGSTATTFYRGETIYTFAPNTAGACRFPNGATYIAPVMPAEATALCTPITSSQFWLGATFNGMPSVSRKICPRAGATQMMYSQHQKFVIVTPGTYNVPFTNSNGTTVSLSIVSRVCVRVDCGNFGGAYEQKGLRNGKVDLFDEDGNELYYENGMWRISDANGIAFQSTSPGDYPPTTNWLPVVGAACVGTIISVNSGDCPPPTHYNIKATISNACAQFNGVYMQTGFSHGRPTLKGPNSAQLHFAPSLGWVFSGDVFSVNQTYQGVTVFANSARGFIPPTTGWVSNTDYPCDGPPIFNIEIVPAAILNPILMCVQASCGTIQGKYTQTRTWNERPDLYDEDQNRLFYWGSGSVTRPEGWYIRDKNDVSLFYNPSTDTNPPTSGWTPFTGDGTSCSATVVISSGECVSCPPPTTSISYTGSPYCSTVAEGTVTRAGVVGGTYSSTTGLTLDSQTGKITPSSSTAGAYTVTYTVNNNGCLEVVRTQVAIASLPTVYSLTGGGVYCSGSSGAVVGLSGSETGVTYQLKNGNEHVGTPLVGTGSVLSFGSQTAGVYTVEAIRQAGGCTSLVTGSVMVQMVSKPTISLAVLQQTLNEGNSQTFCDTDANPVNSLQFNVSGLCVVGSPVWRVQVGSGVWSAWSSDAPVSQLSNNQPHRYQAACDATCPSTYTTLIELTINYRASVPQNVSLLVDGVTVAAGETKEVCSVSNTALTFNANCGANEVTLYSVDGGEYSSVLPMGLVDNQFHNYRVRCRKSDGTPSCVESESGVMRLKLVTIPSAPTVSLTTTSGCDAAASFSGQSSCGSLRTVWYNATTNVALPNLPSTVPSETTSYYARCQTENGCVSERSNVVTFTLASTQVAPEVRVSQEVVCTGTTVQISANCPVGSQTFWNTGVTTPSFEVSFNNVIKQSYWAKCVFAGGCQSAESARKDVYWDAFVVRLINIGESKSSVKVNDRSAWSSQFITRDGGPELGQSTQQNPTLYFVENANKVAPRYWTINADVCGLGTNGSLTFDMLAAPEMGVLRSFNTHENNAPYFMYANREGWTELYAQNHPAYGFYQDNGAGGNVYDAGLPKGLYKLGIRYWDMKGWGSIYPSTRKAQGNVLAYQEYWFRIQSKDGVGVGAAREATSDLSSRRFADARDLKPADNGSFATILPNPVTNILRLQVQANKGQAVQTTLTDASGRRVLSRQFVPETNTHQEEFRVSELPAGMYFLQVNAGDKQATLKVVKVD